MLMSLDALVQSHNLKITGVLHLGAHLAEEAGTYFQLGCEPVWWVEANPFVAEQLARNLEPFEDQKVLHGCVYSADDVRLPFNITNYDGMSSSIFEFGTHPQFSPDTVFEHTINVVTTTVDTLVEEHRIKANFLNMDLQGAELHALIGAERFVDEQVDYIMTEVNCEEVYVGCAKVEQLDEFLTEFERVDTYWVPGQGWGDALYLRRRNR